MTTLDIILNGDGAFPDLAQKRDEGMLINGMAGAGGSAITVAGLAGGTSGGNPSVTIRVDLPDGHTVLTETTLRLFLTAADALKARYGDPRR